MVAHRSRGERDPLLQKAYLLTDISLCKYSRDYTHCMHYHTVFLNIRLCEYYNVNGITHEHTYNRYQLNTAVITDTAHIFLHLFEQLAARALKCFPFGFRVRKGLEDRGISDGERVSTVNVSCSCRKELLVILLIFSNKMDTQGQI